MSAVPGYRESTENWSEVLRDIKRRGLSCPRLVVGDGHLGIWGALRNVPQAAEQRCWNHKIVNVLAKLPKRQQDQAKLSPTRRLGQRLSGQDGVHLPATIPTRRPQRPWSGTGTAWSPSMTSQRSTGGTLHDEPGRITLRGPQASDRCRPLQEGRSGDSGDLENVDGRRTALQASEGPWLIEDVYPVHSMRMESPLNQRLRRSPPDVVYTPIDVTQPASSK